MAAGRRLGREKKIRLLRQGIIIEERAKNKLTWYGNVYKKGEKAEEKEKEKIEKKETVYGEGKEKKTKIRGQRWRKQTGKRER